MADISAEIAAFQAAVYGEDVRQAIIDLANKLNDDLEDGLATITDTLTANGKVTTTQGVNFYADPTSWPTSWVHPAAIIDYVGARQYYKLTTGVDWTATSNTGNLSLPIINNESRIAEIENSANLSQPFDIISSASYGYVIRFLCDCAVKVSAVLNSSTMRFTQSTDRALIGFLWKQNPDQGEAVMDFILQLDSSSGTDSLPAYHLYPSEVKVKNGDYLILGFECKQDDNVSGASIVDLEVKR